MNECETLLAIHLKELGVSFEQQFPVCVERRWKWDFYLPEHRIAIEIDGFFRGRHGAGWGGDYEKQNWGTMLGFRCLRFSTSEVKKGKAKAFLQDWLQNSHAGT